MSTETVKTVAWFRPDDFSLMPVAIFEAWSAKYVVDVQRFRALVLRSDYESAEARAQQLEKAWIDAEKLCREYVAENERLDERAQRAEQALAELVRSQDTFTGALGARSELDWMDDAFKLDAAWAAARAIVESKT